MDLRELLDNYSKAKRADEMKNSDQLMFIELINKLEAVKDKSKPIRFDNGEVPSCLGSWRGVYAELYIGFDGDTNSYDSDEVEKVYPANQYTGAYTVYKEIPSNLPENPTAQDMLELCLRCLGKDFEGYKGGTYNMGKTTPVWVSKYGTTAGFEYDDKDVYETKVVGVTELDEVVVIDTKGENY